MPDLQDLFDRSAKAAGTTIYWTTRAARLMIGIPDYETYVAHRRANHPDQPIMTYVEFVRERQQARYAVGKGGSGAAAKNSKWSGGTRQPTRRERLALLLARGRE